jgi:dCTP deaminase
MTLLSDRYILIEMQDGGLLVTPFDSEAVKPASIDLRLGRTLLIHDLNGVREHDLINDGPFRIAQGMFVLGATLEWFEIGPHLAGELVGKSSRAREGLIVEAAGYFDPGWKGEGTLEISCRSPLPATLEMGMAICQLRIHPIEGEVLRPYGSAGLGSHYQGSRGPKLSYRSDPKAPVRGS